MRHWKKKPWVDSEVRNWDYIADHLAPDATASDAGKVLTVGETGKPEWGEGGGSGGGVIVLSEIDYALTYNGNVLNRNQFEDLYNNNAILFFKVQLGNSDFLFGYVNSYDTEEDNNISIIVNEYNIAIDGSSIVRRIYYYNSTDDCWYSD